MTGRLWIAATALGVLLATGGVVALARTLGADGDGGTGGGAPRCATSAPADDAAGPKASPGMDDDAAGPTASPGRDDDYWTPERMRDAKGAGQGENVNESADPTPTCR